MKARFQLYRRIAQKVSKNRNSKQGIKVIIDILLFKYIYINSSVLKAKLESLPPILFKQMLPENQQVRNENNNSSLILRDKKNSKRNLEDKPFKMYRCSRE